VQDTNVTDSRVLFCPFCAEPFEGLVRCPTHDLALVPFRELPRARTPDDARVALASPTFGRGALFAGAVVTLVAFFCPLVRLTGQVEIENTLRDLATGRAPRLWLVPATALAVISILMRRRTPAGMRGARLALCLLSLLPSGLVLFTLSGAAAAAQRMAEQLGAHIGVHWGVGAWLTLAAAIPLAWGSLRFGVPPKPRVH
jgi:hypothetical protein